MTLVSTIIADAYREGNLIPIGSSPSAAQESEGLRLLNRVVASTYGLEAGENLRTLALTEIPADYEFPINTRVLLTLSQSATLTLPEDPLDGCRMAIVDLADNFATYPLTVSGNGRLVDGAETQTYDTSIDREFFYRADTGNWELVESLGIGDELPFPNDLDDYFITALSIRLAARYGIPTDINTVERFRQMQKIIRAKYRQSETVDLDWMLASLRPDRCEIDTFELR